MNNLERLEVVRWSPDQYHIEDPAFRRVYGLESELGTLGHMIAGGEVIREPVNNLEVLKAMRETGQIADLDCHGADFLSNGSKFHSDGGILEYATPETRSLRYAVASALAGYLVVADFIADARERKFADYYSVNTRILDEKGNTWGSHENYLVPVFMSSQEEYVFMNMATHYATRNTLLGAGAVVPDSQGKCKYVVSQKYLDIGALAANNTTKKRDKPLVNQREEPLSASYKYWRMHVTCGDPTMSPWGLAVRFGSTSLVMRLLEHGVDISDLQLENPVATYKRVAHDLSGRRVVRLADNRRVRPIEIQKELARRSLVLADIVELPEDEVRAAEEWYEGCEDFERDPSLLADRSDHVAKRVMIESKADRSGEKEVIRRGGRIALNGDFYWGELGPKGIGLKKMVRGELRDPLDALSLVGKLKVSAPPGRAEIRSQIGRAAKEHGARIFEFGWTGVQLGYETSVGSPRINLYEPLGESEKELAAADAFIEKGELPSPKRWVWGRGGAIAAAAHAGQTDARPRPPA